MSTIVVPQPILSLADLADCVCASLQDIGAGPTCWCGLYPGAAVSWDYCTECGNNACGMGYVRLASISAYESFPTPVLDERCARPLAWGIEVGALRCFPASSDGQLVDPTVMAEVAMRQMLDANALREAIKCCGIKGIGLGPWVPVGPTGVCVGGYWLAFIDGG